MTRVRTRLIQQILTTYGMETNLEGPISFPTQEQKELFSKLSTPTKLRDTKESKHCHNIIHLHALIFHEYFRRRRGVYFIF